jgi:hypothetical protein
MQVLRLCKIAIMRLQGHVKYSLTSYKVVTAGIWMVLLIYEEIISAFEEARKRYPTAES